MCTYVEEVHSGNKRVGEQLRERRRREPVVVDLSSRTSVGAKLSFHASKHEAERDRQVERPNEHAIGRVETSLGRVWHARRVVGRTCSPVEALSLSTCL